MKLLMITTGLLLVTGLLFGTLIYAQQSGRGLSQMDTDNDGKVSRQEYLAQFEKRFDKIDTDGDGFLSQEEFNQAREKMKERRGKRDGQKPSMNK